MDYQSTRGGNAHASAAQAIVQGLAQDGGLFVPSSIPKVSADFIEALRGLGYQERALRVLAPWLPDFSEPELSWLINAAYGQSFDVPEVALTRRIEDGLFMLELWHGPTLAFKDMALQLMPHLMTASKAKVGESREILILVATSGDTGKAALEGFKDVPGTSIVVFYPNGGVSEAQRLQMVTQDGDNTHVIAVDGNFDDAQTGVKRIFADAEFAKTLNGRGIVLSSANSINLGRLLPQIVYYFSAYADMRNQGEVAEHGQIDICVPTGNFGNILAAAYAREMGLPVRKLICASNSNNVLAEFIDTGIYDKNRAFHLTTSPSMDILISSNLERMVYQLLNGDSEKLTSLMADLGRDGRYQLPDDAMQSLRAFMVGGCASEDEVMQEIKATLKQDGYLLDTHTAVALSVLRKWQAEQKDAPVPALVASTASPYKFGRSVLSAIDDTDSEADEFACCERLAQISGQQVPDAISALKTRPVRHSTTCAVSDMPRALLGELGTDV